MIPPLQITFRNMKPSELVAAMITIEAAKLDRYYHRITRCRVVVEAPHRHHKWGEPFHLLIELGVPGESIVVEHAPSLHGAPVESHPFNWVKHLQAGPHSDMDASIRDAFRAIRRRLEDYARRLRGDVKIRSRVPTACADKLHPERLERLGEPI